MTISTFLILVSLVSGQVDLKPQLNDKMVQLDPGKSVTYSVPAIDPQGKRVTLSFLLRGKGNYSGGFTHGLQVRVNGKVVPAAQDRRMIRLLNKPLRFTYKVDGTFEKSYAWRRFYRPSMGWVIIYAPNYKSSDKRPWLEGQWARNVLAVEDLLHGDKPNTIEFTNEHPRRKAIVLLDEIKLTKTDQKGFGSLKPVPAFPDRPPRRTDYRIFKNPEIQIDSAGGIIIPQGGKKYYFETMFSYPGGGYNVLGTGPAPEAGEKEFAVSKVARIDSPRWQYTAEGKYYKITRHVRVFWEHIYIADTITNKTDSTLGIIASHYLKLGDKGVANVLIGGDPDPALNDVDMNSNPTLFIPTENGGVGMVVGEEWSDGISRLQGLFFYDSDRQVAGVRTENLALGPHDSYTMVRSIYVMEDDGYGDYFDFINFVRNTWEVNFRVDGPYVFLVPDQVLAIDDATLIECVKANKIYGVVLSSSWKDPETGKWRSWFRDARWGQPSAQHFRDLVDKAVAKLRRAVPQVKILHKFHSYLNILDDDVEKYRDSWMIDQNGKMLTSPPYRECFYPTMTNTFGKGLFEMIRKIMEEHKVDGIYWDEFIGPGAGYSMMIPHVTFDKWDGYTALIDLKSKKILKTAAKIRILSDPWVKEAIRRITSNGGLLLANAQPCMPYYNLIKFPRMVETNDRALRMLESNLYSPLGYTSGNTPSISVIRERLEYGGVPLRSSLNSKWPVMSLFFPLTPIEIHRGWLLAEERLITARSGKYAWDAKTAATLYKFNARGRQIEAKQVTVPAEGLDIVVPDDGLVILVRL